MDSTLATTSPVTGDIQVMAETPEEMQSANQSLIEWCDQKEKQLNAEHFELFAAYQHALVHKWKSSTLKRAADLVLKRIEFYAKIKGALQLGYYIVPNFPVTCFAVRTNRKKPLKLLTTSNWSQHEQKPQALQAGEGEYQNPRPEVYTRDVTQPGDTKKTIQYFAENWKELDFPINMSKPRIMEASSRAMALKLFDDLGVLPSPYKKADPVIIARIKDPRPGYGFRGVSFMVAWALDTKTI